MDIPRAAIPRVGSWRRGWIEVCLTLVSLFLKACRADAAIDARVAVAPTLCAVMLQSLLVGYTSI